MTLTCGLDATTPLSPYSYHTLLLDSTQIDSFQVSQPDDMCPTFCATVSTPGYFWLSCIQSTQGPLNSVVLAPVKQYPVVPNSADIAVTNTSIVWLLGGYKMVKMRVLAPVNFSLLSQGSHSFSRSDRPRYLNPIPPLSFKHMSLLVSPSQNQ